MSGTGDTLTDVGSYLVVASVISVLFAHYCNAVLMSRYIDKFEEHSKMIHFLAPRRLTHVIIMLGLLLAETSVLLIPLDVANRSSSVYGNIGCSTWNTSCGGIDVGTMWQVIYWTIAIFIIAVIPFTIFYYESYEYEAGSDKEGSCWKQVKSALCYQMIVTVMCFIFLFVTYATTNESLIPITTIDVKNRDSIWTSYNMQVTEVNDNMVATAGEHVSTLTVIPVPVTFSVYMIACMSFLGWFFFVIFAGVGLIAVPTDLINAYIEMPKEKIDVSEMERKKKSLKQRAKELKESGELLKKQYRRNGNKIDKKLINKYKNAVFDLEKDSDKMDLVQELYEGADASIFSALMAYVYLLAGMISVLITFFWILHICLYILPVAVEASQGRPDGVPLSPFLNAYFAMYDRSIPLFGTLSILIFSFYLQMAVMKGNFRVGTRIFIIQIHPMRVGRTLPNSILVNVSLILATAPAISQFCSQAFAEYIRMTDADLLFGTQIKYLKFFKPFFDYGIFTFVFLGFTVLSFLYFITCGRKVEGIDERKMLKVLQGISDDNEKKKKKWFWQK